MAARVARNKPKAKKNLYIRNKTDQTNHSCYHMKNKTLSKRRKTKAMVPYGSQDNVTDQAQTPQPTAVAAIFIQI